MTRRPKWLVRLLLIIASVFLWDIIVISQGHQELLLILPRHDGKHEDHMLHATDEQKAASVEAYNTLMGRQQDK